MDRILRRSSIALALVGMLVSVYLTYIKLAHRQIFCGGSSQCETVNNSSYAAIGGIPIALIGSLGYLAIIIVLLFEERNPGLRMNSTLLVFGMTLAGFIYSAYLTFIEIAVLHAICPYCVVSALVMTALFAVALDRLIVTPTR